jgi:O-antigen/teichoic acid export membrane protein
LETNNIAKGTLQITSTNAIQYLIIGLFYITVTKTNALTPTDLGVLSILSFLASTFSLFTTLALPTALAKFASENLGKNQLEEAAAIQKTAARAVLTLSIAGFVTTALFSEMISRYFWGTSAYAPLVILMATHALLLNLTTLYNSSLQALCLFGKMAAVTIISVVCSRTIAAILALIRFSVSGVLVGYITGSLIAVTAAIALTRGKLPSSTNSTPIKPLLHFSFPLFLSSLTLLVLNWADIVVLASVTSNYALVGIYRIVVSSIGVLSVIYAPIMVTILPVLSARYSLENPKGIAKILRTASRYLFYVMVPSCLGLATIAPTALTFFYGPDYTSGATPLAILSVSVILLALYSLFATALTALGKTKQVLKINIASALSTVALLLTLVPFLEGVGAALTRLTVQAIGLTLAAYTLQKYVKVKLDMEAVWKSAAASTATIPILIVIEFTISRKIPTIQVLTVEILAAASIYLLALYVLKALNSQDFELLRQAFPKALSKYINILEGLIVQ